VSDRWFWQAIEDRSDRFYWTQYLVATGRGRIGMTYALQGFMPQYKPGIMRRANNANRFHTTRPAEAVYFRFGVGDTPYWGGFQHGAFARPDTPGRPRSAGWQWAVPYWAILPPLAAPPIVRAYRLLRRRRRVRAGHCPSCGYDLRATPDRCPECGTIPAR
jgi:hypothetical protein